jgi:hypothetical protein
MRRALPLAAAMAFLVAAGPPRIYRNDALRVRSFAAPSGWELVPQSSYPRLLAAYTHPDGGKLTLAAQKIPVGLQPIALAEQSRAPLQKQGFIAIKVYRDREKAERARLDAALDAGKRFMRQVYVVDGDLGYVVTIIAPVASEQKLGEDFEDAASSLQLGAAAPESPDLGGAPR